jgi:hypothetical protein
MPVSTQFMHSMVRPFGAAHSTCVPVGPIKPQQIKAQVYSGRIVSRSASVGRGLVFSFFIVLALASGCESAANDSGSRRSLHESYHEKPARGGHPEDQVSLLADWMIRVWKQNREGVAKGGHSFVERHAVLRMFAAAFLVSHSNWYGTA